MVLFLPINFHWGVVALILLCGNTIVKAIATKHIGNTILSKPAKICIGLVIIYYLIYVISISYSTNPTEGWSMAYTMLPMLLIPTIFLVSDMRYLRKRHFQALIFLLAGILTARFAVLLLRASIMSPLSHIINSSTTHCNHLFSMAVSVLYGGDTSATSSITLALLQPIVLLYRNSEVHELCGFVFDNLHYNYLSMYLLTAIALLYSEVIHHWDSPRWKKIRWLILIDMAILAGCVIHSNSRSGMVMLAVLIMACMVHLIIVQKRWKVACLSFSIIVILIGAAYLIAPDANTFKRVISTTKNITKGEEGDVRQTLWKCSIKAMNGHWLIGYGCEGYWDALKEQYHGEDCHSGAKLNLDPHNQYLETLLATGLMGLCIMLSIIIAPLIWIRRFKEKELHILFFTLVYTGCILFEATFARQMGLLFIPFWYSLLIIKQNSVHPTN